MSLKGLEIYVAGRWNSREQLLARAESLERQGAEITHKWMLVETKSERTSAMRGQLALDDTEGVKTADVVVVVIDNVDYPYRGTYCEIGTAIGHGVPVVMYEAVDIPDSSYVGQNIFFHHPHIHHVKSWDAVNSFLAQALYQKLDRVLAEVSSRMSRMGLPI